jgi:hypothetical protein
MKTDLDALRTAIDGDRARLCRELGLRADGGRFYCPTCQADGKRHADGDLSVEAGFRCHKCGWAGDGLSLVRVVRACDFPAAVEFARGVFGVTDSASTPKPTRAAARKGKVHRTIEDAAAAAKWASEKQTNKSWALTRTDVYEDADGKPMAAVLRLDRADGAVDENGKSVKTFRPVHAVGGGWKLGDPPGLWPLFNLPQIVSGAGTVFVLEGEKAAAAGASIGLTCTTSAHGAKSPGKTDWTLLRGRDVVVLPDNDSAGSDYAATVAELLQAAGARSVKIVALPSLPDKGDLADFIQARAGTDPAAIRQEIEMLVRKVQPIGPAAAPNPSPRRPPILLPGGAQEISATARELGGLLAGTRKIFLRGGAVVRLDTDPDGLPMLRDLKAAALASDFESVARLMRDSEKGGRQAATCPESTARLIEAAASFRNALPPIHVLTRCPVLIERDGALRQVCGYNLESGVLAGGDPAEDVPLEEARALLNELLDDFRFASLADRARALAAFLTPALVLGGVLRARAPVDLAEADASQSGKGFRMRIKSALYRETVRNITQKKDGGVGGLEESFNAALIRGASFICLDNVRGRIDSPAIESFLTEDCYTARCAYSQNIEIDPRRVVLMMTSNKADVTTDLANRSACVRILKQPEGYQFRRYPEGDILDHVRTHQTRYLGAVFAVVKAWHAAGRPQTDETRHDFRKWAQVLDWMTRNLLDAGPLLDGHRETQLRMTNPVLNWLRDVALVVVRAGQAGLWLRAGDLVDLLAESDVEVPGLPEHGDPSDPEIRKAAQQAVGRKMGLCFRAGNEVVLDIFKMTKREQFNEESRHVVKEYLFTAPDAGPSLRRTIGADGQTDAEQEPGAPPEDPGNGVCAYAAPDGAPSPAPKKMAVAPNAPDGPLKQNIIPKSPPSSSADLFLYGDIRRIGAPRRETVEGDALDLLENLTKDEQSHDHN